MEVSMLESGYDGGAAASMIGMVGWLFILAIYAYFSFTMYKIACKTGWNSQAWWAWVPFLSGLLMLKCASKPMWWFILLMIPVVNIVVIAMVWIEIAKATRNAPFWGIMMLLPFINIIAIGILAFSGGSASSFSDQPSSQPRQPQNVE